MEAAPVVDQPELVSKPEVHEPGRVTGDPPHRHAGAFSSIASMVKSALDDVDAGDLPTLLSDVDGLGASTATDIERSSRRQRRGILHQR